MFSFVLLDGVQLGWVVACLWEGLIGELRWLDVGGFYDKVVVTMSIV